MTTERPDLSKIPCTYCGKDTYRIIYVVNRGQRPVCTDCFSGRIASVSRGGTNVR